MSRAAQEWAARCVKLDPGLRWVLWHLADGADPDGRGAFYSQARLARFTGMTTRSVRRALVQLESLGYIRRGDQQLVAHYRADRRPVVWDMGTQPAGQPVDGPARPDADVLPSMPKPANDRTRTSPRYDEREDADDRSSTSANPRTTNQPANSRSAVNAQTAREAAPDDGAPLAHDPSLRFCLCLGCRTERLHQLDTDSPPSIFSRRPTPTGRTAP